MRGGSLEKWMSVFDSGLPLEKAGEGKAGRLGTLHRTEFLDHLQKRQTSVCLSFCLGCAPAKKQVRRRGIPPPGRRRSRRLRAALNRPLGWVRSGLVPRPARTSETGWSCRCLEVLNKGIGPSGPRRRAGAAGQTAKVDPQGRTSPPLALPFRRLRNIFCGKACCVSGGRLGNPCGIAGGPR